ncbi:MAG: hypothetical protein M1816_006468 [Peltula sp. TS41687]|nr:MAG: hypothetical protein M1816_006468 [Peltula sp. TS41687]
MSESLVTRIRKPYSVCLFYKSENTAFLDTRIKDVLNNAVPFGAVMSSERFLARGAGKAQPMQNFIDKRAMKLPPASSSSGPEGQSGGNYDPSDEPTVRKMPDKMTMAERVAKYRRCMRQCLGIPDGQPDEIWTVYDAAQYRKCSEICGKFLRTEENDVDAIDVPYQVVEEADKASSPQREKQLPPTIDDVPPLLASTRQLLSEKLHNFGANVLRVGAIVAKRSSLQQQHGGTRFYNSLPGAVGAPVGGFRLAGF